MKKLFCLGLVVVFVAFSSFPALAQERPFDDVRGRDLTRAVSALVQNGIIDDGDSFEPASNITLYEMLTWLMRAVAADSGDAAGWAVENAIIDGDADMSGYVTQEYAGHVFGRFNEAFESRIGAFPAPVGYATRSQIAILMAPGLFYQPTEPVSVTGGDISGFVTEDGVYVFKGIPYAAPPVGELRWVAPQPVVPWEGLLHTINWSASVIQPPQAPFMMWTEEFIIEDTGYSEDALALNIWTSDKDASDMPVIFYLYGGGFTSGGASCEVYNGEYMAQAGIVFVSINYRVGALGFMAHSGLAGESGVSGNYAILDAIKALEWVQENIGRFGGDPANVTIMGQSAGAGMTHYLLQSPLAEGLFHRAVSTGFNNILTQYQALDVVSGMFEEVFAEYSIEELRDMDPFALLEIGNPSHRNIDGHVLTAGFGESLFGGITHDVPLMTGMVRGDAWLFLPGSTPDSLEAFEEYISTFFGDLADQALEAYSATEENFEEVAQQLRDDILIARQTWIARARAISGAESDTFVFFFTHVMPDATEAGFGAFHTSEVPYFFNVFSNFREEVWTEEDFAVGGIMSSYLINFARYGNPNGDGLAEWASTSGENMAMGLSANPEMIVLTEARSALFDALFERLFSQFLQ